MDERNEPCHDTAERSKVGSCDCSLTICVSMTSHDSLPVQMVPMK